MKTAEWGGAAFVLASVLGPAGCGGRHLGSGPGGDTHGAHGGEGGALGRGGASGGQTSCDASDCGPPLPAGSGAIGAGAGGANGVGRGGAGGTGAGGAPGKGGTFNVAGAVDIADGGSEPPDDCPVVVSERACDQSRRPILFVHGTYGAGDSFAHIAALLGSNGFCQGRIVALDYDSLGDQPGVSCASGTQMKGCDAIDKAIVDVLKHNPSFTQVDLVCHSQGTAHCATYLRDPGQAAKVAHYVNLSGSPDVGGIDTLSISSAHDLGDTPHHATGTNVTTVTLTDEDHFAVAGSTRSFAAIHRYLTGSAPKYTHVQCGDDPIAIYGLTETFADNTSTTRIVRIRELDGSGQPSGAPEIREITDTAGHLGEQSLKRNAAHELATYDSDGNLLGYYYLPPQRRSARLVRLLTPATAGDGSGVGQVIAGSSTDKVKFGARYSAIVAHWVAGAFRPELGANLEVNGKQVLTGANAGMSAQLSSAQLTGGAAWLFAYDANGNGKSDLGLADSGPFLSFTDVFIDASTSASVDLTFVPGSEDPGVSWTLAIPNRPSLDADGKPVPMWVLFE